MLNLKSAISHFGADAKAKLANPGATGEPEDQLRAAAGSPLRRSCRTLRLQTGRFAAVGESSLSTLKTRPDYAITLRNVLVGFVEVKAPGKGADPRRYKGHDKEQWEKLQSLPNLLYTDGNSFSLWQNGELVGSIVELDGDVESSGRNSPPRTNSSLGSTTSFAGSRSHQSPPRNLPRSRPGSAGCCATKSPNNWPRKAQPSPRSPPIGGSSSFPKRTIEQFADGYAQAVTFGLLMARSSNIRLADGLDQVGKQLGKTNSLIGAALRLLTDDVDNEATLKTRSARSSACSTP